jgi:hypothetical protein
MTNGRSTDIFDLIADIQVAKQRPWRDKALCKGAAYVDPAMFFPIEAEGSDGPGKELCAKCPVSIECGIDHRSQPTANQDYGIWAGTSGQERKQLRQQKRLAQDLTPLELVT